MRFQIAIAIGLIVSMNIGCATLSNTPTSAITQSAATDASAKSSKETRFINRNTPSRIAVIWNADVLKAHGKPPTHGFTGRLYFYDPNDELLEVDGELTVYGYDDSESKISEVADHIYKFPADTFKQRYNKSELGHSYTVWIPWPKKDRFRKSISLVPVLKTAQGQTLMGNINRLMIPGDPPTYEETVEKTVVNSSMYPDAPHSSMNRRRGSDHQRQVDTIQIPDHLANRLINVPQNRIPPPEVLQHLNDMESVERNPNGSLYNRTHITTRQIPLNDMQSEFQSSGTPTRPTSHNFSDAPEQTGQPIPLNRIESPANVRAPITRLGTFGKPGSFR